MINVFLLLFFKLKSLSIIYRGIRITVNQSREIQRFMYKYKINNSLSSREGRKEGKYAGEKKRKKERKDGKEEALGTDTHFGFFINIFLSSTPGLRDMWCAAGTVAFSLGQLQKGTWRRVCVCVGWGGLITVGNRLSSSACAPAALPWWPSQTPHALHP